MSTTFTKSRLTLAGLTAAAAAFAITGGVAGAAAAVPGQAAGATVQPRGDVVLSCSAPAAPAGGRRVSSRTKSRVKIRTYRYQNRTPLNLGLAYLSAAPRYGYKVSGWGAGANNTGPTPGSGFDLAARNKRCGYLAVNIDAGKGGPSTLIVCTGKTTAVVRSCNLTRF